MMPVSLYRWLITALVMTSTPALAEVYKRVMPDGSIVFSDQADPQAEKIEVTPMQTIPSDRHLLKKTTPTPRPQQKKILNYTSLEIISPEDDSVIWDNSGTVKITLSSDPSLQIIAGHGVIQFPDIFKTMARLNYQGDICLELYPYVDAPEAAGRESLAFLRPIFEDSGLEVFC